RSEAEVLRCRISHLQPSKQWGVRNTEPVTEKPTFQDLHLSGVEIACLRTFHSRVVNSNYPAFGEFRSLTFAGIPSNGAAHSKSEFRRSAHMKRSRGLAVAACLFFLPSVAAFGQQAYVSRYDVFTGYAFLDSPHIGLFENGFQFQTGIRPRTWYSIGF